MTTQGRKRTTAADVAAAVRMGALSPDAEYVTAEDADATIDRAETAPVIVAAAATTDHGCTLPGCRHGAAHGPAQPDRQVKLACTTCGAVVRATAAAIAKSGGISDAHGALVPAARRTYARKTS